MSLPRFHAPAAGPDVRAVLLPPEESHHLKHVLRLGPGDEVRVFDGRGREWTGRVLAAGKSRQVNVELSREMQPTPEPPVQVTLGVGLLKGDQMDAVIRDATMLGVRAIVPCVSVHVALPAHARRGPAAIERWQRVAVASAKQCGRAVVPLVGAVTPFEALLAGAAVDARLMCVEPSAAHDRAMPSLPGPRPSSVLALVGPEGGWSSGEIDAAIGHGATLMHLGPRTLRAETAPTVLLSVLWTVWGW